MDRFERVVVEADPARFVITHGEPHRGNTVVTDTGWCSSAGTPACSRHPSATSGWSRGGGGILEVYEQRTGGRLDPRLLEAHRLRWDLADLTSFVRDLRAQHGDDDDSRTAWRGLRAVLDR